MPNPICLFYVFRHIAIFFLMTILFFGLGSGDNDDRASRGVAMNCEEDPWVRSARAHIAALDLEASNLRSPTKVTEAVVNPPWYQPSSTGTSGEVPGQQKPFYMSRSEISPRLQYKVQKNRPLKKHNKELGHVPLSNQTCTSAWRGHL